MRAVAAVVLVLVGCASSPPPRSAFSERVAAGCSSEDDCRAALREANGRVRACAGDCTAERQDVATAARNLERWQAAHPHAEEAADPLDDRQNQEASTGVEQVKAADEAARAKVKAECDAKAQAKSAEKGEKCVGFVSATNCSVRCYP